MLDVTAIASLAAAIAPTNATEPAKVETTPALDPNSPEGMKAEIERLRRENANLAAKKAGRPSTYKVTDKGGISVYGLGQFPVTLYKKQWEKLLDQAEDIRAFMKENESLLSEKPAKVAK